MNEELIKHLKQLRLELIEVKQRLSELEYRLKINRNVEDTFKCDYYAKTVFNGTWSDLSVDQKLSVLDQIKNDKKVN